MSTKQSRAKKVAAPNHSEGEKDDLGALIYRECQLRKAEAAAAAAESKKKSTVSPSTRRTSTRTRSPVNNEGEKSLSRPQRKGGSKGRKRDS